MKKYFLICPSIVSNLYDKLLIHERNIEILLEVKNSDLYVKASKFAQDCFEDDLNEQIGKMLTLKSKIDEVENLHFRFGS